MINKAGLPTLIEIDGRISKENIRQYGKDAVELFVAGSTCIDRTAIAESVKSLHDMRTELVG
jgi:pentose-5-phosphate-3-epimerase